MPSALRTLVGAAILSMVHGQAVILSAVGDKGTTPGLQVDPNNKADANFISTAEISANIVNECGRTLAGGNIDIGEKTETALAAKNVTQVKKGSTVKITMDQRNANGTGPFTCDMDPTGNTLGATGQTALTVKQGSASNNGQMTLSVTMPNDLSCTGSSAGNVCTIRCRNAQDFGGCTAVQQTDTTALPGDNPPNKITTAATLSAVNQQVAQDILDLPAAIKGNQDATTVDQQGPVIAQALLAAEPAAVQSAAAEVQSNVASASTATATTASNNNNGKANKGNGAKAGKGNGNAAAANAATGATAATKGTGANANAAAAKGNGNAATGATAATKGTGANANAAAAKGNGNAAANANAATGATAATKGNANAATKGNANAAAAAGTKANSNNKRESLAERRKRQVNAGVDFVEGEDN